MPIGVAFRPLWRRLYACASPRAWTPSGSTPPARPPARPPAARAFDPHNELLYRDIMRLQQQLGHLDAIPRTLTLLTTRLTEIDETPTAQVLELATCLQQRRRDTATVR